MTFSPHNILHRIGNHSANANFVHGLTDVDILGAAVLVHSGAIAGGAGYGFILFVSHVYFYCFAAFAANANAVFKNYFGNLVVRRSVFHG